MKVRIINQVEVKKLLPMGECMAVMAEALEALARGEGLLPLRSVTRLPDGSGLLGSMPGYAGHLPALGVKVIAFFPANEGTELDSHQGVVLLFDPHDGRLLAVMDATEVTAIRTAAVSGVATRALARPDAADLAILGSGTQARTHLTAMRLARDIRQVRVWSRNPDHARRFAEAEAQRHRIAIETAATAREAVDGASIICTVTSAAEPVLAGDWIAPGAHVNAVGSSTPQARELDVAAVARSRLYVDRRESTLSEAGEFLMARAEGAVTDGDILGELGDVLLGRVPGRRSSDEITLFKSLGLAIEDVAAAAHVYRRAVESGAGVEVDLGGARQS